MGFFSSREHVMTTDSGLHVENVRNDVPEFHRLYTAKLDARCSIKVDIKTFIGSRFKSAELQQPNGRWIIFEIDRVADKIIDPTLVPLVERCCEEILALDRAFMKSEPNEFLDERGVRWRRVD